MDIQYAIAFLETTLGFDSLLLLILFLSPADNFRPYITSFQGNNCTDYINAVFVDGYTHPREYIVTEWPLSNTCSDIWDDE